jgi:hypothetical protein
LEFAIFWSSAEYTAMSQTPKIASTLPFLAKTAPPPPSELAEAGRQLWQSVNERYVIEPVHPQVLFLACLSADAAALMREKIKLEGEIVVGPTDQPAAHPLIAPEGAAQRRVAQFLKQLGLFDDEPKRPRPGRPPNKFARLLMPRPAIRDA